MNRKEAIEYLYSNKEGKKSIAIEVIGSYLYKQFYIMGFISEAPGYAENNNEKHIVYKINKSLVDAYNFYRKPTEEEKKMSEFCDKIGI